MRLGRAHMTPRRGGGGDPEPEEKEEDEAGQMSRKRPVPTNMWPPPLARKHLGTEDGDTEQERSLFGTIFKA